MGLKLIPCAAVYPAKLPSAAELENHLASVPFVDLAVSQPQGSGFVAVEPGESLVYEFKGGYAFSLRFDQKIVPASVVKSELKKWIATFEDNQGRPPSRKEIVDGREIVTANLVSKALVKTKVITCLYDTSRHYLFVPALAAGMREMVMKQLVRAVESIKTQTIHVAETKASLTLRLASEITESDFAGEPPFGEFEVGGKVVLVGPGGKITFDLSGGPSNAENGIHEASAAGAQVTEIALSNGGVSFRLTHDFLLKSVKFLDGAINYDPDGDPRYTFEQEAACQLLLVRDVVDKLCKIFDYKPKTEDDGSDLA